MSRQPVTGSAFALGQVVLLQDVPRERLEVLARECSWYRYAKGAEVIAQETTGRDVFFIASGAVRVRTYSTAGRQVSFRDVETGAIVGDIAAVDGGPRSTDVTALVESTLAALPAGAFMRLLHELPVVQERYLLYLTGLVRRLTERVTELSTLDVSHRVQSELLRLARQSGSQGNVASIDPAPTHAEIADQVSTRREQVTRELSALAKRGLLEKKGTSLVVTDLYELERLLGESSLDRGGNLTPQ
ncbi:MAG TPA: Crp/Fnr family transcriptional regulator [Ramlibacter sp.]|nr:Crp/Fnr family transcriptional regulator [Ramlibacter sp.]